MKKIFSFFIYAGAGLMVILSSCSKKIDEAFENPNAPKKVPPEALLPGIIGNFIGSSSAQGSAYGLANDGLYVGRYVQFWATSATGNQYDQMGGATGASDVLGSIWAMHYYGMGQNLGRMIDWAAEEKKWDYVGVGYAIRAWSWLTLTDIYGEAILRQAFDPTRLVFDYDTQEDIYAESRRLCHLALEYLSKTGDGVSQANLAKGDAYFYNGDVNKWKKFVYSVLARSFHHLTNKSTYVANYADSVLYYSERGITSYVDNATAKFQAEGLSGTYNFFGPFRGNVGALRQSRFISNLMTGLNPTFTGINDPRAPYIIRENPNGNFKGVRPNKGSDGLATADQPKNFWGGTFSSTAAPGTDDSCRYIFRNGAPFPIITSAEMHFVRAEAFLRKGDNVNAKASYQEGIKESFRMLINTPAYQNSTPAAKQLNSSQIDPFVTSVTPSGNVTKSQIMLQKFIAMYGWGLIETWMDIRRYHYTDDENGFPAASTSLQVYADFTPPTGSDLFTNNANKWVYRARPRYNSEYLYNVAALSSVGALALDYHTKEQWVTKP